MTHTVFLTKYPAHEALTVDYPNKPTRGWDINSPIFRHRAVMHLFPEITGDAPRASSNILFRLDTIAGSAPYFLIQSDIAPETNLPIETKQIELTAPAAGTNVSFRLAINAIKRKRRNEHQKKDRKRGLGIIQIPFDGDQDAPEHLPRMSEWLSQKLSPALNNVTIINHQRQVLGADRRGSSKDAPFAVQVDLIDGVAQVQDPSHLEELLFNGIGRAKSYGCGLLSIRTLVS